MDLGTLIGLIFTVIIVFIAIAVGPSLLIFVNIPSILIVIGGTVGVTLIKFQLSKILNSVKIAIMSAFFEKTESPKELIELAAELSKMVQKDGILALEGYQVKNKFFGKGVELMVDGHDPEFIKTVLLNEMRTSIEQSEQGESIFRQIGDAAPAMGMIGTLVGLIQMLAGMDDPSNIGPAMAVALLTTLYGALIAQVFALPLAEKLFLRSKQDREMQALILASIISIQQGQSPSVMTRLLESYINAPEDSGKKAPAKK